MVPYSIEQTVLLTESAVLILVVVDDGPVLSLILLMVK